MHKLIDKSKINIRISYGTHATAANAGSVEDHVKSFRPHVYMMEAFDILGKARKRAILTVNASIASARKDEKRKELMLRCLKRLSDPAAFGTFMAAEYKSIVERPGTILYYPEEYSKPELKSIKHDYDRFNDARPVLNLVYQGRSGEALLLAEDIVRQNLLTLTIFRNERTAEGFEAMCSDLPALFPEVEKLKRLRVFARYGTMHAGLTKLLESRGFRVSQHNDDLTDTLPTPEEKFCRKLEANRNAILSDGEKAEILFEFLYDHVGPNGPAPATPFTEAVLKNAKLRTLGGSEGFMRMLNSLPRHPPTGFFSFLGSPRAATKDFVDELRNAMANA